MERLTVYLNGSFIPLADAKVSILDRGFMFADGVYEVLRFLGGHPFEAEQHLARLRASLEAVRISFPEVDWLAVSQELLKRNKLTDASCYWQITRGCALRSHAVDGPLVPTVLAMAQAAEPLASTGEPKAVEAILKPDIRWSRCDIKSLMLLPNVLAKMQAHDESAFEAIFHRDGIVTEGSSTSLFIVHKGRLLTHPADGWILGGITRNVLIEAAKAVGMQCIEKPFDCSTLLEADEVILTGTTTLVASVVKIDEHTIGDGQGGPVAQQLYSILLNRMQRG